MRPFASTIPLEEARRRLSAALRPIERSERVRLEEAAGRVATREVRSPVDVPPFSRSAMDGYAVRAADTTGAGRQTPVRLRLVDRVFTGKPSSVNVPAGACAEIATGAPVPGGADAVVMVEETARDGESVIQVLVAAAPGQHIGRRGGDIAAGGLVISAGDLLTPSRIGAIAAIGSPDVEVFARPRVAILSTGNEVVEPGQMLAPGQIFDVNRFTLSAVVSAHGGAAEPRPPAQDSVDALVNALDACAGVDLIVFSGGSSV
ncbi:MAG TPA: molybdopterin-binding protein, partial [Vicinamibacterales bacterium]|nr:molybdopterin-binding protein [Vicinamibacterales bacterium]